MLSTRTNVSQFVSQYDVSTELLMSIGKVKHGPIRSEPDNYDYDESDRLLGSCALESELFMVKWKVKSILRILVG